VIVTHQDTVILNCYYRNLGETVHMKIVTDRQRRVTEVVVGDDFANLSADTRSLIKKELKEDLKIKKFNVPNFLDFKAGSIIRLKIEQEQDIENTY
jgi:hypothetical protein